MHYGEIKKCDIANGEGVRVSLFVSGCTHHCPGCFNQDTWNFSYGNEYTDKTEKEILDATIQSPDFGSLAYDTAMDILEEKEVQRDITVTPRMITGDKK